MFPFFSNCFKHSGTSRALKEPLLSMQGKDPSIPPAPPMNLSKLPSDMIVEVASHLPLPSQIALAQTCKELKQCLESNQIISKNIIKINSKLFSRKNLLPTPSLALFHILSKLDPPDIQGFKLLLKESFDRAPQKVREFFQKIQSPGTDVLHTHAALKFTSTENEQLSKILKEITEINEIFNLIHQPDILKQDLKMAYDAFFPLSKFSSEDIENLKSSLKEISTADQQEAQGVCYNILTADKIFGTYEYLKFTSKECEQLSKILKENDRETLSAKLEEAVKTTRINPYFVLMSQTADLFLTLVFCNKCPPLQQLTELKKHLIEKIRLILLNIADTLAKAPRSQIAEFDIGTTSVLYLLIENYKQYNTKATKEEQAQFFEQLFTTGYFLKTAFVYLCRKLPTELLEAFRSIGIPDHIEVMQIAVINTFFGDIYNQHQYRDFEEVSSILNQEAQENEYLDESVHAKVAHMRYVRERGKPFDAIAEDSKNIILASSPEGSFLREYITEYYPPYKPSCCFL